MKEENLKKLFPLSQRWVMQRVILCITILLSILFCVYKLDQELMIHDSVSIYRKIFFYGISISLIFIAYSILYLSTYEYRVVGDELIIKRGVLIKKPVGIPLSKINAIHIRRKIHEIIFGLATVVIVVPGDIHTELSSISGMSLKNAEQFKAHLFSKN